MDRTTDPLRSAGPWGLALAVFYAVFVRFYQAAGGRIGLPGTIENPAGFERASYAAGVLILAGGAACLILTHGGGRWHRRPLLTVFAAGCGLGGVFAVCHGIGGIVTSVLEIAGVIDIDKSLIPNPTRDQVVQGDWWNVLLYEPWFLLMGVALCAAVAHAARRAGVPERSVRRGVVAAAALTTVLAALAIASIVAGVRVSVD